MNQVSLNSNFMKEKVIKACLNEIETRIQSVNEEIEKIKADAANETKSSMGDKYETGREMMMQERNKLGERLEILLKQKVAIELIDDKVHDAIKNGSLVETNQNTFLIATALGAINIDVKQIFVISQSAPLAREMAGKKAGDSFSFNGREQKVLQVS